jgi:RNase H-like protein
MDGGASLERRLANFRAGLAGYARPDGPPDPSPIQRLDHALRLAETLDAAVIRTPAGSFVLREQASRLLAIDRDRLARLPGQPPADAPLLCLDTETTGLATAAGTLAFLVGLGWWQGDEFHQAQLLLPDHPDEPALLEELASRIAPEAWLVTYNGRGFDWPLLVTRFRLARRGPPAHAGHLDLLPLVRRVFRHRMANARLQTVESDLLGTPRHGDVQGWEIPGLYLDFLRAGAADGLAEVVDHNAEDVLSLARLLAHVERGYAEMDDRAMAPPGDLAGLARAFARERRLDEALACLDAALAGCSATSRDPFGRTTPKAASDDEPAGAEWWSPDRRADFGGRPTGWGRGSLPYPPADLLADPWTPERIARERGHMLRRLGRYDDAATAFSSLAATGGAVGLAALIEVAKLREHRLRDPAGAFDAVRAGWRLAERSRGLGRPMPRFEADLVRRGQRLRGRLATAHRPVTSPPVPAAATVGLS